MSRLLIEEHPIMIMPSLAVKLGVNEAGVLQQIHYWLVKSKQFQIMVNKGAGFDDHAQRTLQNRNVFIKNEELKKKRLTEKLGMSKSCLSGYLQGKGGRYFGVFRQRGGSPQVREKFLCGF